MNWKGDNWTRFFLALVITVAILVSGQLLWHKFAVAKPLDKGLLAIQGVSSASWDEGKNSDIVAINVTLSHVDSLAKTYNDILEKGQKVFGRKNFQVILHDDRTPELDSFYYTIHYSIQEAIATGNFTAMADKVQTQARAAQIDAKIVVDEKYVYVQLAKGDNALYTVVPRQSAGLEVK